MEKTNKNLDPKCQIIYSDITIVFSSAKSNMVLIAQTKEITKILAKGIFLIPKGYKRDKAPVNKIAI